MKVSSLKVIGHQTGHCGLVDKCFQLPEWPESDAQRRWPSFYTYGRFKTWLCSVQVQLFNYLSKIYFKYISLRWSTQRKENGHCLPDTKRWKGTRGIVQWENMITYSPNWIFYNLLTKYLSLDRIFLNHLTVKPAVAQDSSSLNNNVAYALCLQYFNSFWLAETSQF